MAVSGSGRHTEKARRLPRARAAYLDDAITAGAAICCATQNDAETRCRMYLRRSSISKRYRGARRKAVDVRDPAQRLLRRYAGAQGTQSASKMRRKSAGGDTALHEPRKPRSAVAAPMAMATNHPPPDRAIAEPFGKPSCCANSTPIVSRDPDVAEYPSVPCCTASRAPGAMMDRRGAEQEQPK